MKNQYFGDRRDLFKYDLLLDLVECAQQPRLTFIPMLTPNDGTGEGSFTTYNCGGRRQVLYDFLRNAVASRNRDIRRLRDLMPMCGVQFMPYRDGDYFDDTTRSLYFDAVPKEWLAQSIIFLDPDIGIQTGSSTYMRGRGSEKYVMYADLTNVAARATADSVLVVYQHLQNDATKRVADVERRLRDLQTHLAVSSAWAVQWNDLAFLVSVRDGPLASPIAAKLRQHAVRHNGSFFGGVGVQSDDPHALDISGATTMTKTLPLLLDVDLNEIVHFLNDEKIRATYKAVAEVIGGIAQSIGQRLGKRRVEASWVVNASSGMPTGYLTHQRHPALLSKTEIISSGSDLQRRLVRWRAAGAPNHLAARSPGSAAQRAESKPLEPLSVNDLADLRRKLTTLLNSFDHVRGTQGEGVRKRINRLSHDGGPIPREIAALMTAITEMRNSAEYESKVLSASECAVVRHAWQAIQEWAQSPPRRG